MQKSKRAVRIAWGLGAVGSLLAMAEIAYTVFHLWSAQQLGFQSWQPLFEIIPVFFAIPAALIISRHPRNAIGWLLMIPAISLILSNGMSFFLMNFQKEPPPATLFYLAMAWFTSSSWLALIIPLILIPILFPTGRPISSRWKWPLYLAAGMCLFFYLWSAFTRVYQPDYASWQLVNPVGFLSAEAWEYIMPVWVALLGILAVSAVISLAVRYRRSGLVEREQMKWLLYACSLFTLGYLPGLIFIPEKSAPLLAMISNLLFILAIPCIPTAITIAILRYHLFDIDVIIRQTLVFAALTGLLGLVYAGGIILTQFAFRVLTGQTSDLAIVVTTLAIAALFNPLRQRVQAVIDRRFYRQRYNAEQALTEFAHAARMGMGIELLTDQLTDLVQRTLQPAQVNLIILVKRPEIHNPTQ